KCQTRKSRVPACRRLPELQQRTMIDVAAQRKCCDTNAPARNYFPSGSGGMQLRGAPCRGSRDVCMKFASGNTAGVAPPILEAIVAANRGFALGYGRDEATARVTQRLSEVFERDVAVFLVATGTAANALALAHLSPPWGAALCHDECHLVTDE